MIKKENLAVIFIALALSILILNYDRDEIRTFLIFCFYFFLSLIFKIDSRYPILAAIFFLVVAAILLAKDNAAYANKLATYAYYFLVVGVLLNIIELLRKGDNKFLRDKFLRYNAIMLIFTLSSGALNYLYQVLLGRILTPEEFGTIGVMISIFYITSIASWTISRSVTNFVAGASKEEVAGIIKYSLRKLSIVAILSGVAFIILTPILSRYLKIKELELFYIMAAMLILSFIVPVFQGNTFRSKEV